jgi:hypothetical protein
MSTNPTRLRDEFSDEDIREMLGAPRELPPERTPPSAYAGPWVERVKAISKVFGPPPCEDGEVRCTHCTLPSGAHPVLNRHDRRCYWCGSEDLVLVGERLRAWYRVPAPPALNETPKAEPPAQCIVAASPLFASAAAHIGIHTYKMNTYGQYELVLGSGGAQCPQCQRDMQATQAPLRRCGAPDCILCSPKGRVWLGGWVISVGAYFGVILGLHSLWGLAFLAPMVLCQFYSMKPFIQPKV